MRGRTIYYDYLFYTMLYIYCVAIVMYTMLPPTSNCISDGFLKDAWVFQRGENMLDTSFISNFTRSYRNNNVSQCCHTRESPPPWRAVQPLDPDITATKRSVACAPPPAFVVFLPSTEQVHESGALFPCQNHEFS